MALTYREGERHWWQWAGVQRFIVAVLVLLVVLFFWALVREQKSRAEHNRFLREIEQESGVVPFR